jgi:DNA-binding NarL/FixJ family response regulator
VSAPTEITAAWDAANLRDEVAGLPRREWQVLVGLGNGWTRFQIGAENRMSPNTVITYRNRLFKRLEVHSAFDALRAAWRRGLFHTCPTCRRPR